MCSGYCKTDFYACSTEPTKAYCILVTAVLFKLSFVHVLKNRPLRPDSVLKGNRPMKCAIDFLLKLHTVVECNMISEKNEIKNMGSPCYFSG